MTAASGKRRRPSEVSVRRAEARRAALTPPRPVSPWPVLWVACEACGKGRHVDMPAGRHAAMPVTAARRAAVADWPRCRHAVPFWQNCAGAAVVPPCCLGEGSP